MAPHRSTPAVLIVVAGALAVAACSAPAPGVPPPAASGVPPSSYLALLGVSCATARYCVAVGSAGSPARVLPVAAVWDGRRWIARRVPGPAGSVRLASRLTAVSCSGPSRCVAVGGATTASGDVAFADSWDGTRWRTQPLSYPAGPTDLAGVSCRASMCLVTGRYFADGQERPVAFELDGTAQQRLTPAIPRGQDGGGLAGVWCSTPSACMTVGSFLPARGDGGVASLAEEWDGAAWRVLRTARPAGAANGPGLVAVACPATALCLAVGGYYDAARGGGPFAVREIWRHGRWRMLRRPGPGSPSSVPAAVACPSVSDCVAVGGSAGPGAVAGRPGADQWTGGTVRNLPVPQPRAGSLTGVSCASARACVAVGYGPAAFAELWNGSDWRLLSTP